MPLQNECLTGQSAEWAVPQVVTGHTADWSGPQVAVKLQLNESSGDYLRCSHLEILKYRNERMALFVIQSCHIL